MNEDLKQLDELIAYTKRLLVVVDVFLGLFKNNTIDELSEKTQSQIMEMISNRNKITTMLTGMMVIRKVLVDVDKMIEEN